MKGIFKKLKKFGIHTPYFYNSRAYYMEEYFKQSHMKSEHIKKEKCKILSISLHIVWVKFGFCLGNVHI